MMHGPINIKFPGFSCSFIHSEGSYVGWQLCISTTPLPTVDLLCKLVSVVLLHWCSWGFRLPEMLHGIMLVVVYQHCRTRRPSWNVSRQLPTFAAIHSRWVEYPGVSRPVHIYTRVPFSVLSAQVIPRYIDKVVQQCSLVWKLNEPITPSTLVYVNKICEWQYWAVVTLSCYRSLSIHIPAMRSGWKLTLLNWKVRLNILRSRMHVFGY